MWPIFYGTDINVQLKDEFLMVIIPIRSLKTLFNLYKKKNGFVVFFFHVRIKI